MFQRDPYALLLLVSATVGGAVGTLGWRRRSSTPAAAAFAVVMLGIVIWTGLEGVAHALVDPASQEIVLVASVPGGSIVVLAFFWQCRLMVDRHATPSRRGLTLTVIEPLVVILGCATNASHGWIAVDAAISPVSGRMTIEPGPLFWLHIVFCYTVTGGAYSSVVRAWRTASALHRRQLRTVLIAGMLPAVGGVPMIMTASSGGSIDFAAIAFLFTGLLAAWAMFRQGLLRLVPVARGAVLERVSDAVLVIDPAGIVLDLNPAAIRLGRRIRPNQPADPVGHSLFRVLDTNRPMEGPPADGAYRLPLDGGDLHLDVRTNRLTDRRGNLVGYAIVVRDVTELNARKHELTVVNARLHEQVATIEGLRADLAEQTVRDVLTGVHNRRHLMRMITREVAEAAVAGDGLGVVLLDIDHFKRVNDRLGHAGGDRVLVAIAQALAADARDRDTVARYGGEEFVALLPGTTRRQAWARAEEWRRLCTAVSGVTLSAGVAVFPDCGRSPEALLQAADEALYEAKAAGRDRVLLARPTG